MRTFPLWLGSALAAASLACTTAALAFGPQGHEVVGATADALLHPVAKAKVKALLGMPLLAASTWADCVKDVMPVAGQGLQYKPDPRYHASCLQFETKAGIARMVDYATRNWTQCSTDPHVQACHKTYHFADVAIQHDHYDRAYAGTSDHDIVSVIGAAIDVLQGRPAPAHISIKDKTEALLLLAHLLGDVHQPLHVGSVYLDKDGKPVDPGSSDQPVDKLIDTHGGNAIEDGSTDLHAEWDAIRRAIDPKALPAALLTAARAVKATPGPMAQWPGNWASATVVTAQEAYAGLTYSHAGAAKPGDWVVTISDRPAYAAKRAALQEQQLALAGARLAQLLNAIWP